MSVGIALLRPKYRTNFGGTVRACACFGANHIYYTGNRLELSSGTRKERRPREMRKRDYSLVGVTQVESIREIPLMGRVPVAVEVKPNFTQLPSFTHPTDALYIFGPEDGSVDSGVNAFAHEHIIIPTKFCLNLAAAVNIVLYDRMAKSGKYLELEGERVFVKEDTWVDVDTN